MALTVLAESLERRIVDAQLRRTAGARLTTEDATRRQRERRNQRAKGVYAALTAAGIRLTLEQKRAIDRVVRLHPELLAMELSPPAAVERLIEHGVEFTDAQLELVADEGTISGLKRVTSAFEALPRKRTTATHPPVSPAPQGLVSRLRNWFATATR